MFRASFAKLGPGSTRGRIIAVNSDVAICGGGNQNLRYQVLVYKITQTGSNIYGVNAESLWL